MINLINIFLYFYIANILFIITSILISKRFKVTVKEIITGQLPILKIGKLNIGLIPMAASIKLSTTEEGDSPQESFDTKTKSQRFFMVALPWIINIIIGISSLNGDFLEIFSSTYHQLFVGALHPFSYGQQLIGQFFELCQVFSWQIFVIFLIKMTAINLLPFAAFSTFQILIILTNININDKKHKLFFTLAITPTIILMAVWSIAIINYVADHI